MNSGAGSPSLTIEPSSSLRRAIGVVRVSRVGDREGERFVSPSEQRERIASACERDGLQLLDTLEEPNVSGGAPLARRPGLRRAVELVEAGQANVVVVAYFDRLVRSLQVQREVVERVERAGGAIIALDVGEVRADTAGRWLSSTMLGMVAEYHRRVTAERTAEAKRRALDRGVPPFPNVPPGYRRRDDGRLEPHPTEATTVADAFQLRAGGATVMDVRTFLRDHGIERSYHGVQAKSERLLARLGVLRCGTCGGRLVVGTTRQGNKVHAFYRCSPTSDCPRRVTVSADLAEQVVVDTVRELLDGSRGTASVAAGVADAEREVERCGRSRVSTM